jgi:hypothetical protein
MIKEKDFRMKKDVPYVSMLLLIVAGMVLGVIGVSEFNGNSITYAKNALPEETQIQDKDSEKSRPIASPLNWADVSEMAMPAVVSIYTTKEWKCASKWIRSAFSSRIDGDSRSLPMTQKQFPRKVLAVVLLSVKTGTF